MRWLKIFVFLRLPGSVATLLGFATLNVWRKPGMGIFGVALVVVLFVYMGFVSVKLYRRWPHALILTRWLMLLEFLGAVVALCGDDIARGQNLGRVAVRAGLVLVVWTLPNAVTLHQTWEVVSRMRMPMK
jgi:hypothetical protein